MYSNIKGIYKSGLTHANKGDISMIKIIDLMNNTDCSSNIVIVDSLKDRIIYDSISAYLPKELYYTSIKSITPKARVNAQSGIIKIEPYLLILI